MSYQITVTVPDVAGKGIADVIWCAVADAVFEHEPADRGGWDISVDGKHVEDE